MIDRSEPTPPAAATVDLVFVLDQRPDMTDLIIAMKTSCLEKVEVLQSEGMDCRFAVIPFGRKANHIPYVLLMGDLARFKQQLTAPPPAAAAELASSASAALEQALGLEFRKDTPVLFYLISKTPCENAAELAAVGTRMDEHGITAIIQADAARKDSCRPLYQNGGRFFSMEGNDLTGPVAAAGKSASSGKGSAKAANLLARLAPDTKARDTSQLVTVKGIFALRTAPDRAQLILKLGGSQESERAVQEGLAWLARHQADDGHWSDERKCEREHPCQMVNYANQGRPVAETGLAILAFQAGGNYDFNNQKYSEQVKRGLEWLVKQQEQDGRLFGSLRSGDHDSWYQHGIGTFALAEACAVALANNQAPEPRYRNAAERAVKFMERHQYAQGGWQYALDSSRIGDSSVTGWQMLALKSALEAKIDVAPATLERLQRFFETVGDPATGQTGYQSRGFGTDLTTAVGLIFQEFLLKQSNSPFAQKAVAYLKQRATQRIGQTGDFYTLYNGTLAMFLARGDAWKQWNNAVRDAVVKRQEKNGCARGSWSDSYGRTLGTAWAVLTLEVYYRYASEDKEDAN
jgi:hypothetical protein